MGLEINKVKYKSEWPLVRLKELCNRISDGTHFTPNYTSSGIPFISVKDIYADKVHFDKCKYIDTNTHLELTKRCKPEKEDILITKSGTIGRMALVPDTPEFSLFVSVALIKSKRNLIHSKFLKYCLNNFLNSINISQDIKGGLLKNFHLEDIRETIIPVVPLEEQERITSKIEELISELDKGIENLRTAQLQLKTYRQAVLKWAFEGKLTNNAVKEEELPKGWNIKTIDEIGVVKGGKRLPKGHIYSEEQTNYPYLRVTDFENQTINLNKLKYLLPETQMIIENYTISKNDVYISIAGTIGVTGTIPEILDGANLTENAAKITSLHNAYNKYLSLFLSSIYGQAQIKEKTKTTTQPKLSLYRIDKIEIPIPPINEQQAIVQAIESRLSVADNMEENIMQSLQQAEALRKSILKKAFEGILI